MLWTRNYGKCFSLNALTEPSPLQGADCLVPCTNWSTPSGRHIRHISCTTDKVCGLHHRKHLPKTASKIDVSIQWPKTLIQSHSQQSSSSDNFLTLHVLTVTYWSRWILHWRLTQDAQDPPQPQCNHCLLRLSLCCKTHRAHLVSKCLYRKLLNKKPMGRNDMEEIWPTGLALNTSPPHHFPISLMTKRELFYYWWDMKSDTLIGLVLVGFLSLCPGCYRAETASHILLNYLQDLTSHIIPNCFQLALQPDTSWCKQFPQSFTEKLSHLQEGSRNKPLREQIPYALLTQIYPLHIKKVYHQGNHLLPGHLVRRGKKEEALDFHPCEYYYPSSTSTCNIPSSVLQILLKIKHIKIKIEI